MLRKRIIFPEVNKAELIKEQIPDAPEPNQVLIKTAYSTISPGTERANITGDPNVYGKSAPAVKFPRGCGYSSAGVVVAVGSAVKRVQPGDRVIAYWGFHTDYNLLPEKQIVKIVDDNLSLREASAVFISTFPLAALRKTRLELGESCLVMGLGLLGQFAVRLARAAGAVPIIACDPVAIRRNDAIAGGADYAFDPFDPDFVRQVKKVSRGGVNTAIEVTGQGEGLVEALDCMARFGRIALLGCTRDKEFTIDYYRKVHCPGITLIGAHTMARPETESHPGWFTHDDDICAIMRLCAGKRLNIGNMLSDLHTPDSCAAVYNRLIHDREFPMAVQIDWTGETEG